MHAKILANVTVNVIKICKTGEYLNNCTCGEKCL